MKGLKCVLAASCLVAAALFCQPAFACNAVGVDVGTPAFSFTQGYAQPVYAQSFAAPVYAQSFVQQPFLGISLGGGYGAQAIVGGYNQAFVQRQVVVQSAYRPLVRQRFVVPRVAVSRQRVIVRGY